METPQRLSKGCCLLKHGQSRTPLYKIWVNMKDRCGNPNNPYFHNYGGRGIKVCPSWAASFATFAKAVGERPSPRHTLDRKNNQGNYSPRNVTWATRKAQARNQRKNRLLTFQGRTLCVAEWAEEMGLRPSTLFYRLDVVGMPVEQVLTTPRRGGRRPK